MTTTERVRFTIAVDADVYEAFAGLAHSSGVSMSRCIGDWLRDTAEAAQMTTIRVNEVRKSHQEVHRLYVDSTAREIEKMMAEGLPQWGKFAGKHVPLPHGWSKEEEAAFRAKSAAIFEREQAARLVPPRPVIRGGKSPEEGRKAGGKRSS